MERGDAIGEVNRAPRQLAVEVKDDELARNRADIAFVALHDPGLKVETPSVAAPRAARAVARCRLLRRLGAPALETLAAVEHSPTTVLGLDR